MDAETIRHLNSINQRFYATVTDAFDASRQRAWAGWDRVLAELETLHAALPIRVLDVGCGNGRFGVFLADKLGGERLRYHGSDSSAALLERAQTALAGAAATFDQRDLVEQPLDDSLGQFDLVALFGVLHHIPGADQRRALMRALAGRVAPGGLLVFTEWRFADEARFQNRIVAWDAGINVEPGDYLLDWRRGTNALRYCHHVDDAEHARLIAAAGLALVAEYRADAANLYTLLKNESLLNSP